MEELDHRQCHIRVVKIKVHTDDLNLVPLRHKKGNNHADAEAKKAAISHSLPSKERKAIYDIDGRAWMIRERLIAIVKNMPPQRENCWP